MNMDFVKNLWAIIRIRWIYRKLHLKKARGKALDSIGLLVGVRREKIKRHWRRNDETDKEFRKRLTTIYRPSGSKR